MEEPTEAVLDAPPEPQLDEENPGEQAQAGRPAASVVHGPYYYFYQGGCFCALLLQPSGIFQKLKLIFQLWENWTENVLIHQLMVECDLSKTWRDSSFLCTKKIWIEWNCTHSWNVWCFVLIIIIIIIIITRTRTQQWKCQQNRMSLTLAITKCRESVCLGHMGCCFQSKGPGLKVRLITFCSLTRFSLQLRTASRCSCILWMYAACCVNMAAWRPVLIPSQLP